jgi:hypothetical protein
MSGHRRGVSIKLLVYTCSIGRDIELRRSDGLRTLPIV